MNNFMDTATNPESKLNSVLARMAGLLGDDAMDKFLCALTLWGAHALTDPSSTINDGTDFYEHTVKEDCNNCLCISFCPLCRFYE